MRRTNLSTRGIIAILNSGVYFCKRAIWVKDLAAVLAEENDPEAEAALTRFLSFGSRNEKVIAHKALRKLPVPSIKTLAALKAFESQLAQQQ